MQYEMLLVVAIALPFAGSCFAIFFPTNARNAEAYLAGGIALINSALAVAAFPLVVGGGVLRFKAEWVPALGLEPVYTDWHGFSSC